MYVAMKRRHKALDYAYNVAKFRKVLIIASCSSNPITAIGDEARFFRFATILSEAGFDPLQTTAFSISHLADCMDDFKPDFVFCAPDHLPATSPIPRTGPGESPRLINVHGWLEEKGIPYVGSSSVIIELALSKSALKEKWVRDGISTPAFLSLDAATSLSAIDPAVLPPFPMIVKPSDAGNSRGITKDSVVSDKKELEAIITTLGQGFRHILIEHYLGFYPDFREFTCACIGNGAERILMPAELVFLEPAGIHVITTEDKDNHKTDALAVGDPNFRNDIVAFASKAFSSAGVRDYSRCDLAFADGRFWAIEVNGQPMIPDAWFEACARHAGLSEREYILAIIAAALRRISEDREFPVRGG
jgi:D-alanine-D-alanine ligase